MRFVRGARFVGWGITVWLGVLLTLACLALLLRAEDAEEGVRSVLRTTARTSHFFLMLAFCARPLRELWLRANALRVWPDFDAGARASGSSVPSRKFGGGFTFWLRYNRRYLGNALTVSHGLHLGAVIALPLVTGEHYNATTLVAGGALMAIIAALAATSSDAAQRALGKNWTRLHRACMWVLAIAFTLAFLPPGIYAVDIAWQHIFGVGTGAFAFALRGAAWWLKRKRLH